MSKGAQMPEYAHLMDEAVEYALEVTTDPAQQLEEVLLKLCVLFGREILQQVPGQVSSEVDVRHSYDAAKQVALGRKLIAMYEEAGVPRERVLVKMASTWEGICAARVLESEGIHCNLTLLFSFAQAVACAEAGVTLISPFVARVGDWYRENKPDATAENSHLGVDMVVRIYRYYRCYGFQTIVMPASLRTPNEIKDLAGCDAMTMSPALLDKLAEDRSQLVRRLDPESAQAQCQDDRVFMTEVLFRQLLERDVCATEKMAQAMQGFSEDTVPPLLLHLLLLMMPRTLRFS
eukprot:GGOE01053300.1.p2 GENE.GGOE01053300.1~~GGOE01053300.1.p2  ORF type:complete len:337 (-),score=137.52 GGOE01053300.1:319-1191(-)